MSNQLLSYAILGTGLAGVAGFSFLETLTSQYDKQNVNVGYTIEITYLNNNETKKIELKTQIKPDKFIEKLQIKK